MCEFCLKLECNLTKEKTLKHGAILEDNTYRIMRMETENTPQTYGFDGVPAFYSLSALIPDENEKDPHAYIRFEFDEDTECDSDWECEEIQNPLEWQAEEEFLEKFNSKQN